MTKVTREMQAWDDDDKLKVDVHVESKRAKGFERNLTSHWSRTQATCALSAAEQEYYAVVTWTAKGLRLQSLLWHLGQKAEVRT